MTLQAWKDLDIPKNEAVSWHQLGVIAERQENWTEAERCYRTSIAIKERLGDIESAIVTCSNLGFVMRCNRRPNEAEKWYRQALTYYERVHPGEPRGYYLHNVAAILIDELLADRTNQNRLAEAKSLAEQALTEREKLKNDPEIWMTLGALACIAELENQPELGRKYRQREHELYAAVSEHVEAIDCEDKDLIAGIVAVACGDTQRQTGVVQTLLQKEKIDGWMIIAIVKRIWAGERDWHALTDMLPNEAALLLQRVLTKLPASTDTSMQTSDAKIFASLPESIRIAIKQRNTVAFEQDLAALTPDEKSRTLTTLRVLQKRETTSS